MPASERFSVFVGNLPFNATEDELADVFQGMQVADVRIMRDRNTNKSRGFGYVNFSSANDMEQALTLDGVSLSGRPLRLDEANSRGRSGPSQRGRGAPRGGGRFGEGRGGHQQQHQRQQQAPPQHAQRAPPQPAPVAVAPPAVESAAAPPAQQAPQGPRAWWQGHAPVPQGPTEDANGVPIPATQFVFDARQGEQQFKFVLRRSGLHVPEECARGLDAAFVTCDLLQSPTSEGNPVVAGDDNAPMQELHSALSNAAEYNASVSCTMQLGTSRFLVPKRLVDTVFGMDDLKAMLEAKAVRHVFLPEVTEEMSPPDLNDALLQYSVTRTTSELIEEIETVFVDKKVAWLAVDDTTGQILPDNGRAATAALSDAAGVLTGAKLQDRAGLCTIQANGRLTVPPSKTNDIRVMGSKTIDSQVNRRLAKYTHKDTGFSAIVASVSEFDHTPRFANPDRFYTELELARHSLNPADQNRPAPAESYPIISVCYINVQHGGDVAVSLAEVPPSDEGAGAVCKDLKAGVGLVARAVDLARGIVALMPPRGADKVEPEVDVVELARQDAERQRQALRAGSAATAAQ